MSSLLLYSMRTKRKSVVFLFQIIETLDVETWTTIIVFQKNSKILKPQAFSSFHYYCMSNMIIYLLIPFIYSCVIRGLQNESPAVISFQETFKEGSNLTIVSNKTKIFFNGSNSHVFSCLQEICLRDLSLKLIQNLRILKQINLSTKLFQKNYSALFIGHPSN